MQAIQTVKQASNIMLRKAASFRLIAIPACMLWGVLEFIALQRARLQMHRRHA